MEKKIKVSKSETLKEKNYGGKVVKSKGKEIKKPPNKTKLVDVGGEKDIIIPIKEENVGGDSVTSDNKPVKRPPKNKVSGGKLGRKKKVWDDVLSGPPKDLRKEFRISSKKVFLTYPRCDMPPQDYANMLQNNVFFQRYGIADYAISREFHQVVTPPETPDNLPSGESSEVVLPSEPPKENIKIETHLHVYIHFFKKIDTRSPNFFDITFGPNTYHGNYQSVKKTVEVLEYITKGIFNVQQASEHLVLSPGIANQMTLMYSHCDLYLRMIFRARMGMVKEAMMMLEREDPAGYVKNGAKIQRRLQDIHLETLGAIPKYPLSSFVIPERLRVAMRIFEDFMKTGESKVLFLQGPPDSGKTQFLLAYLYEVFGQVLKINNIEGLKNLDLTKHRAILFDDPQFNELSREQLISLFDCDIQSIKIRYTLADVPVNFPKAVSLNCELSTSNPRLKDLAVKRRIIVYEIKPGETLVPDVKETVCIDPKTGNLLDKKILKDAFLNWKATQEPKY